MNPTFQSSNEELHKNFLALRRPQDIGPLLETEYPFLEYMLYVKSVSNLYQVFALQKRNGENRQIRVPSNNLKYVQHKLLYILRLVYSVSEPAHGFVTGKSIRSNAENHVRQTYVLNVDLEDFFPSINFGRVRGLFMAYPYSLPARVATVLAQICCVENELPQGAPTSPIVSNMICARMDRELSILAERRGCIYTRYADDLTFSTSEPRFPKALAYHQGDAKTRLTVGAELRKIINRNGFNINHEKLRLQRTNQRQEVTGLTVNSFPNVSRQFIRQIRAMLHAWEKYGLRAAEREHYDKHRNKNQGPFKHTPGFDQIVKGKIDFLGMVRGKNDLTYIRYWNQLVTLSPNYGTKRSFPDNFYVGLSQHNKQTAKFEDWIETLPYPLASILWLYFSSNKTEERVDHLLHFFEALTQFLATLLLSIFAQNESELEEELKPLSKIFSEQKYDWGRPVWGLWKSLFEKLASTTRKHINGKVKKTIFEEIDKEFLSTITSTAIINLSTEANRVRNSRAHGDSSFDQQLETLTPLLGELQKVFGNYWENVHIVNPIEAKRIGQNTFVSSVEICTGTKLPFRKKNDVVTTEAMFDGELHLISPESSKFVRLLPFVKIIRSSSMTKRIDGSYYYNRREQNGQIKLVSFDLMSEPTKTDSFNEITNWLTKLDSFISGTK